MTTLEDTKLSKREKLAGTTYPIAPRRQTSRIIFGVIAGAVVTWVAIELWLNPALDHATIFRYLTVPSILAGVVKTVLLAIISMAIGVVGGFIVATFRLSANPILRAIGFSYVALLRSVPLLVLILVMGNLSLFWSEVDIVNPFNHADVWAAWKMNDLVSPFVASVLALAINEAAYMGEIIRAGIRSIDPGQSDAATALGLGRRKTMLKVVLPQTFRIVLPPTGSQFVTMLKMTSLVSVIAGGDLLTASQNIAATNLRTLELLVVASIWYLVVTGIATIAQTVLESRLERGHRKVSS